MKYRRERTAPVEGDRKRGAYRLRLAPIERSGAAMDAVRETWRAIDRADVDQLACEADPEAFVGAHVNVDYCRPLCEACPIQAECLALGWSESRAGRASAMYGGLHFPPMSDQYGEGWESA